MFDIGTLGNLLEIASRLLQTKVLSEKEAAWKSSIERGKKQVEMRMVIAKFYRVNYMVKAELDYVRLICEDISNVCGPLDNLESSTESLAVSSHFEWSF